MDDQLQSDEPGWPQRAVILIAVGAVAALIVQQLMQPEDWHRGHGAWRDACATGVGVAALAFGFGLGRVRIAWTMAFAPALGLLAGLIQYWNGQPNGLWTWSGASLVLAVAIAVPLFQVARDEGRLSLPYSQVHGHAWTNIVLWGACWGFTGIVVLLSHLLAELFALIGIDFLKDWLSHHWSNALIIGAAFGAALGLLRDRDRVVRLLQRVVTSVLGFLAPILGVALILFLLSLPFTGLSKLWEATKSTTPVLMACVIGALILANAVIGHGPDDEAKSPVLRWSALALGVAVLPLAIIAAVAMGLRIGQYGMTPDRLWGLTVVVFAVAYGLVYLADAVRGRLGWASLVRRDNIRIALATMVAGLVLATPILGFNAISTNDQVARLKSGKVSADKFDWAALAFDFGEPGERALAELRRSANAEIAQRADDAAKANGRYEVGDQLKNQRRQAEVANLRVLPAGTVLPADLRKGIADSEQCDAGQCTIFFLVPNKQAIVMDNGCFTDPPASAWMNCGDPVAWYRYENGWAVGTRTAAQPDAAAIVARNAAYKVGKAEVRTVTRRQVFIGGVPVGPDFE
ncbi:MAG: DUF4153 domain-containing protein [Sphingomonas sp.]|uniref:DUF4153 domain-containing protein n=1 Tax=Sphingomonas sp. TaxID=28214 RepID=UPI0012174F20|nr:DUF4153 domain-containing protein [Sphingomonas sp.]THD36774.1 MAG: DUF4153 domain-containing protein [Sphingomonas sp.]